MKKKDDYKKTFEEFWAPIVMHAGRLVPDRVERELADYLDIIRGAEEVFVHVTNGRFSKANTDPAHITSEHEARRQQDIEEALAEAKKETKAVVSGLRRALRLLIRTAESEARTSYRGPNGRWRDAWKETEPHHYDRVQRAKAALQRSLE